jgi:hypothetical protein
VSRNTTGGWRRDSNPNHLFTRSRHNVRRRAPTTDVWRNEAEQAPEVRLRCCHGCCQSGHDH